MIALVRAELLKLRTVRATWGYVLATAALTGLGAAGTIGSSSERDRFAETFQRDVVGVVEVAWVVAVLLGATIVTSEFRHGTITPTLLVVPVRERLLAAKAAAATLAGAALGLLGLAVVAAIAVPWLAALDLSLEVGDRAGQAGRLVLAAALAALLAAAVGSLVHTQVGTLVGALVWLLIAEPLLGALLPEVGLDVVADHLPGDGLSAVSGGGDTELGLGVGLAVTIAYILVLAALGVARTRRRDIT